MGPFHHPAARLEFWIYPLFMRLFASLLDVRLVVSFDRRLERRFAFIARIGAEIVLAGAPRRLDYDFVQRGLKQFDVMRVCAAGDERERDANPVDQ